ncbi:MAG: putative lipid II flippase FtsW [Wenzhouxiangellaceae bacterium]
MTARPGQAWHRNNPPGMIGMDWTLINTALALLAVGVIMVGSTSVAVAEKYAVGPWHFLIRHLLFIGIGVLIAALMSQLPMEWLKRLSRVCLPLSVLLLLLVFVPGLGVERNGAQRWLNLGLLNFQAVEAVKLLMIIHVAGYLAARPGFEKSSLIETLKPLLAGALIAGILLKQPDMGSAVVLMAILGGMVWLAGAAWRYLSLLGAGALPVVTFAALEPYRLRRLTSFTDPFADPYGDGFQMVQALIAIGRGELTGVGIGASVQKLFYLPEAHTDFIFAILAEETGLLGITLVLALFALLVWRIFVIGLNALELGRAFEAFLCFGVGLWIGLQALIAIGVNLRVLPTKGLTLPLLSAGGSSMLMVLVALALVIRIGRDNALERLKRPVREWAS